MDDKSLLTIMTEVEGTLNSKPLTAEVLNDPTSLQLLLPVNILTMKSKIVSPQQGEFSIPDIYCRKHWQFIEHIANEFWSCWKKEKRKNGKARKETSKLEILLLYTMLMFQETTGLWHE